MKKICHLKFHEKNMELKDRRDDEIKLENRIILVKSWDTDAVEIKISFNKDFTHTAINSSINSKSYPGKLYVEVWVIR